MHVLLRQQDAHTLRFELKDHLHHLLDNHRRHTFGRLVEQDQKRVAHQRAGDSQHLLLAAAHAPAQTLRHFTQIGKQRKKTLRRPAGRLAAVRPVAWRLAADFQVFHHGEVGEDAPVFRYKTHAQTRRLVRLGTRHVVAHETDLTAALFKHTDDGLDGGGLAGAVTPHQGHHFATPDFEAHVVQNLCGAIPGAQPGDFQKGVVCGLHQTAFSNVLPLPK